MFVTRARYEALYRRYVEAVRARALAGQVRSAGRLGRRLMRALRACARYRAESAALRREVARYRVSAAADARRADSLQAAYDHAVGLDSPALDMGVHWQQRRSDRPVPKAVES